MPPTSRSRPLSTSLSLVSRGQIRHRIRWWVLTRYRNSQAWLGPSLVLKNKRWWSNTNAIAVTVDLVHEDEVVDLKSSLGKGLTLQQVRGSKVLRWVSEGPNFYAAAGQQGVQRLASQTEAYSPLSPLSPVAKLIRKHCNIYKDTKMQRYKKKKWKVANCNLAI